MTQAILSTKYQLVIPRAIRQRLHLRSGQRMMFLIKGNVITLVPERSLSELRGIARGIKHGPLREKNERPV
ncbi:MAG: AbrB/MazE/SpoVT family DNA-binding domain-containing protein [Elusimicrobia bacterium]|nr:AbrB/MazE/SpoVT family DNA-binding domain-containing protein [Elusimicrobiota bacterium]